MAKTKRHPGTIEKRGSSFRVILYVEGERHTFTLKDVSRSDAEEYARTKHGELTKYAERVALGLPGATPFSAFLDKYKTERLALLSENSRKDYGRALRRFERFFVDRLGDPKVDKIRSAHVRDYMSWRRVNTQGRKVASNRTVQKDRAILHAVFTFADELEIREGNPVTRVSSPKVEQRNPVILSPEQFERLLSECERDPMLWLYALTLAETGGRCESEVLFLRFADVDLQEGFLWIYSGSDGHRTKSGKGRHVPMTPRLRKALREHFARFRMATYDGKRSPWVFHHPYRRRRANAGERIGSLRRSFMAACERAEIPKEFHAHDLRHRRVTTWLAEGKSAVLVKEAVGHSDLKTTMGYTHLAKEHLRALVDEEPEASKEELKALGT